MAYIDREKIEETKVMIVGLLQEFIDEYKMYSASSIDYHYGRAEGVETARTMIIRRLNTLLEQPTADVVEVVRCKDCKHYSGSRFCFHFTDTVFDDDFCSYGTQKERGGEK